jgi:hypothetical protein
MKLVISDDLAEASVTSLRVSELARLYLVPETGYNV